LALITNYDTLVTATQDYLARSDLAGFVPNFLQNAQGKLYRTLRIRQMETALTGTTAAGVVAVPADYLELKFVNISGSPYISLERTSPEFIYATYPLRSNASRPKFIAREGSNFIFGPAAADGYSLVGIYYALLPLLSASNTTNFFTTNAPEVLLYGALLEAQPFLMNDKRIPVWTELYAEAIGTVARLNRSENFSGSNLAIKAG
jgi:hypothetical protein